MKRKNILIVEDEGEVLEVLAELAKNSVSLNKNTDNIFLATDGKEASEILKRIEIDALITDLRMPLLDGVALINEFKKEQNKSFPVIIISGFATSEIREQFIASPEIKIYNKPYDLSKAFEELDITLGEIISPKGA